MLNDFTPWPSTKLDEFRIAGDKLEERGKPPASIYLVIAFMEQHNRFCGAVYGPEHIPGRENDLAMLVELGRRPEVLHTPELVQMAFDATVRNSP